MTNRQTLFIVLVLAASAIGCCKRVTVPPAIDLKQNQAIGVIQFKTNAKGGLAEYGTRKFMEAITKEQKGAEMVELGEEAAVLKAIGKEAMDPDAIKAIRDKYNVNSVITGYIEVSDVKPRIDIGPGIPFISAHADVEAKLMAKLVLTANAATIWTGSGRDKKEVGHVSLMGGFFHFDAKDPEEAYGKLVESLVKKTTKDFRSTKQRVKK